MGAEERDIDKRSIKEQWEDKQKENENENEKEKEKEKEIKKEIKGSFFQFLTSSFKVDRRLRNLNLIIIYEEVGFFFFLCFLCCSLSFFLFFDLN